MVNIILGLDPSTVATGWAVLALDGYNEGITASGVYEPSPGLAFDDLLMEAYTWCLGVVQVHLPDTLAIETPFFALNAKTLAMLAGLGAVLRLAARLQGMEVHTVAPSERCTALGLSGQASKEQVLHAVNALYNLNLENWNESDAVAVAAAGAQQLRAAVIAAAREE